ncbi:MAG: alpha/beta fold hydrolase [Proteobacteria bacterium]|nr:alpha/beta fold hydrolase [Pseudomonadota bacterium]
MKRFSQALSGAALAFALLTAAAPATHAAPAPHAAPAAPEGPMAPAFVDPATPNEASFMSAPSGVRYQYIGTYDLKRLDHITGPELDAFLTGSPMPASAFKGRFPAARFPVRLYRVKYPSVVPEQANRPTLASGLVAIPQTGQPTMPVVSYQHGTVFNRGDVPSFPENSMETRLVVARFASQGYVVVAADYFGRGLSTEPDSYLVKRSTEQACVDMLFAGRAVLAAEKIAPGPLFLSGWSQGGWVTMTVLKHLETLGMPVTATATASAPVDVFATVHRWINNVQPIDAVYLPGCMALHLQAQEAYLGQMGLAAFAIRPEYLQASRDLYTGKIDWVTFRKLTPARCDQFLRQEFRDSGNLADFPYWQTLERSQAYRWRSHTPIITYYGVLDEVVPVYIARLAEAFHTLMGSGPTQSRCAGEKADHRATFVHAVIEEKPWFDTFLANAKR